MSGFWLSRGDLDASAYDISPDGLEVAFAANVDTTGIDRNFDIILLPTCGCKPSRNITAGNKAGDGDPHYSPDGRRLAFAQRRLPKFYADRARLMIYDRAAGTTTGLTEKWDRSVDGLVWEARFTQPAGNHRRRRHAARVSLPARWRGAHRADQRLDVRRACAGRAMARARWQSARTSSSRPRW